MWQNTFKSPLLQQQKNTLAATFKQLPGNLNATLQRGRGNVIFGRVFVGIDFGGGDMRRERPPFTHPTLSDIFAFFMFKNSSLFAFATTLAIFSPFDKFLPSFRFLTLKCLFSQFVKGSYFQRFKVKNWKLFPFSPFKMQFYALSIEKKWRSVHYYG